jgi:RNA polymerase subunit RPABC4/transcription elongation factor Spt4
MAKTCENCGSELKEGTNFCPECGSEVSTSSIEEIFCPNCGANVKNSENFCEECGFSLNSQESPKNESFIEKYKIPIIIGLVVVILAIIGVGALSLMGNDTVDNVGPQTVEVGSTDFTIPGDFMIVPSTIDVDYKYSTATFSKGWSNEFDSLYINTMLVPYNVDAQEVISSQGGIQKNMMGYDGYYTEDDGIYTFAFETGGYICVVSASSPYVLDEVTCLG